MGFGSKLALCSVISRGYDDRMDTLAPASLLEDLIRPLSECLTPESATRLLEVKADSQLQARVDELADRQRLGTLSAEETSEYAKYVSYGTLLAILKSKARQLLSHSAGV